MIYRNAEIWHIPTLNKQLHSHFRTGSANAFMLCARLYNPYMSFDTFHKISKNDWGGFHKSWAHGVKRKVHSILGENAISWV